MLSLEADWDTKYTTKEDTYFMETQFNNLTKNFENHKKEFHKEIEEYNDRLEEIIDTQMEYQI